MSTATTTDTGQTTSHRITNPTTTTPATQTERSAANRLRSTFVPVRLAFTWLGVRKTLAPEQVKAWPREGHHILAQFDDETVVVFQAYGPPSAGLPLSTGRSARASASPV